MKDTKIKQPTEAVKSPTPEDIASESSKEASPEKDMKVDRPKRTEPEQLTEPKDEEPKSLQKTAKTASKPKDKQKIEEPKSTPSKPSLIEHDVDILELGLKDAEYIEKLIEKPEEKESIFVSGIKLKKSSVVKRAIEKPKLETVDLVSHDDESLPISEEVSCENYV